MKPRTTRTLNRLPFQDLEPHRFEDLVRGLAHGFREWRTLEDTGRTGDDDGIDIRGEEVMPSDPGDDEGDDAKDAAAFAATPGRMWVFQCKREKRFSAADVDEIVAAVGTATPPHGFVVAVASDVTKRTRDRFRTKMVEWGVQEFYLWARGELEDLLFQPRHDHLLFAFFGISLQSRRRSAATEIRSRVAIKRLLRRVFKVDEQSERRIHNQPVVIRQLDDGTYPRYVDGLSRWRLFAFDNVRDVDGPMFQVGQYLAWISPDETMWDVIPKHDISSRIQHRSLPHDAWSRGDAEDAEEHGTTIDSFWREAVDDADKAHLHVAKVLSFDNIVAIDPIGDGHYPVPHVFVQRWTRDGGPFEAGEVRCLTRSMLGGSRAERVPSAPRSGFFPRQLDCTSLRQFDLTAAGAPFDPTRDARLAKAASVTSEGRCYRARGNGEFVSGPTVAEGALERFDTWRTTVALPLMSTVVHRLLSAGFDARVAARLPHHLASGAPQRSIELRFSREVITDAGHSYTKAGYFRVQHRWADQCEVSVSPMRRDSRGTHHSEKTRSVAELTDVWLEEELVALIERFVGDP